MEVFNDIQNEKLITGNIDYDLFYFDLSNLQILPQFVGGRQDIYTCTGNYGIAFARGTPVDGVGASFFEKIVATILASINKMDKYFTFLKGKERKQEVRRYYKSQGKKLSFIDASNNTILLTGNLSKLPAFGDRMTACIRQHAKKWGFQRTYPGAIHSPNSDIHYWRSGHHWTTG